MTKRPRRTRDQWQALIAEYHASDLSAEAFCQLQDLGRMSFDKWRLRFSRAVSAGFTEVESTPPRAAVPVVPSPLTLALGDARLELPADVSTSRIAELMQALARA